MKIAAAVLAVMLLASSAAAQTASPAPGSNPEMLRLFAEDQADRKAARIDWSVVNPRDDARRTATRRLLADGTLHTGEDYNAAAFVFQHGETPDDFLLAHTLAMVAVAKGQKAALWIASATLDRYLWNIERPQIYGTQYGKKPMDAPWTQAPYDRDLVSDALRRELGVPTLVEQEARLKAMQSRPPAKP